MRAVLALLLLLAAAPLAAPAEASHTGPCTHEYLHAFLHGTSDLFVETVENCTRNLACWSLDVCWRP